MREIPLDRGVVPKENIYPVNYIQTARYTILNIVPKNLYEQFHRSANIWFLVVSIFQLLPLGLSVTSNWETIAPLAFLLSISLIKDAIVDIRRHKSDKKLNNKEFLVWNGENFGCLKSA
jgi:phospholipid-transporting ATPase